MSGHEVGEARAGGWLDVTDGHRVWWEEAGNPDGLPALILHGGPGSGFSPRSRRFFDPARYRVVGMDQRGCGRSTPHASGEGVDLSTNTTAHLIADIEALRLHLGVEAWVLYGNSWGSTLALAYAETHPERVRGIVLAGVTTTRRREIDWLYRGLAPMFPAEWERFRAGVPPGTPDEGLLDAYGALLFDADPAVRRKAARDFHDWDTASASAAPAPVVTPGAEDESRILGRARLCTHYFTNGAWLADGQLLAGAVRLAGIPGVLVQGRLDLQGPLVTAWELARAWPDARLDVIDGAGHSSADAGMTEAVTAACDELAARLG